MKKKVKILQDQVKGLLKLIESLSETCQEQHKQIDILKTMISANDIALDNIEKMIRDEFEPHPYI